MMKTMKKAVCLLMIAAMILCLAACGGPKVEITLVAMSESKMLNVQYKANADLSKEDVTMKVSVSNDKDNISGTVYCLTEVKDDLKSGSKYVGLFDMTATHKWTVDGSLKMGGSTVLNEVETADILSMFGDDAEVTASFLVKDETVSEMKMSDD